MPDSNGHPHYFTAAALAQKLAERRARDAADAECGCAFAASERLAGLLDRHAGDAGSDPDALASVTDRITALADEVETLIGKPAMRLVVGGRIVGLVREARA